MSVTMLTAQQVTLTAVERDSNGAVVQPASVLQWSVDNSEIVGITPAEDGMTCVCISLAAGVAVVTVADTEWNLTATEELSVATRAAASLEVTAGEPSDVPAS